MYGEVVDGVDAHRFEQPLSDLKRDRGVRAGRRPDADDLAELIETYKAIYEQETGTRLPAGRARAAAPRLPRRLRLVGRAARAGLPAHVRDPGRPRHGGQRRADGLRQQGRHARATGVCFTRNPATGEALLYGEFLQNAQGEDVVAGHPHARADRADGRAAARVVRAAEGDRRGGSRSTTATCRTSSSRSRRAGSTSSRRARASGRRRRRSGVGGRDGRRGPDLPRGGGRADRPGPARPAPAPDDRPDGGGRGRRPAGSTPPRARPCGAIVLDADAAEERGKAGESVILVRWETTPDDFHGHARGAGSSPRTAA